jgi:hypothetical protein
MEDLLVGIWKVNMQKSEFNQNHRPREATMAFEIVDEGHFLLKAEGLSEKGAPAEQRPVHITPDGKEHASGVPGVHGRGTSLLPQLSATILSCAGSVRRRYGTGSEIGFVSIDFWSGVRR